MDYNFAAFILTHGRPNKVYTYKTLRSQGYSGKIFIVIDDEDATENEYRKKYGDEVVQFSKEEIEKTFDTGDNFKDKRGVIIYARNACFEMAKKLGIEYFIELDDDYTSFTFRFDKEWKFKERPIKNLDRIFEMMIDFYVKCGVRCKTIAMAQGGDFIGGGEGTFGKEIALKRKAMNTFICSVNRPFKFIGRINEDVNTYTSETYRGMLFLSFSMLCMHQKTTQSNIGGMTEVYIENGTYMKSFYSVMYHPSGVKVRLMNTRHSRLHHAISWNATAPKIVREEEK